MSSITVPQKRRRSQETDADSATAQPMSDAIPKPAHSQNVFIPAFEYFRIELDEHHDRRERVVKASRDITAASKKMIFALQRAPPTNIGYPPSPSLLKQLTPHTTAIRTNLRSIQAELRTGPDSYRYARNVSPGLQEWVEAVVFRHYLASGKLLTFPSAGRLLRQTLEEDDGKVESGEVSKAEAEEERENEEGLGKDDQEAGLSLGYEDYILGLFDATGELMRYAITAMATTGSVPIVPSLDPSGASDPLSAINATHNKRTVLTDLQALVQGLARLDVAANFPYAWKGKMEVARQSVDKVERALYGLVVRGAERPKGWMPALENGGRGEEIEA